MEELAAREEGRPSVTFLLAHDSLLELGEGDQELEQGAGHLLLPRPLASSPAPTPGEVVFVQCCDSESESWCRPSICLVVVGLLSLTFSFLYLMFIAWLQI